MEISEALKLLRVLAEGIDPFTGEEYPDESPYQHPKVIRALYKAVQILESQEAKERARARLPEHAGESWDEGEDAQLASEFEAGLSLQEIACRHKRTVGAIQSRLVKQGRLEATWHDQRPNVKAI